MSYIGNSPGVASQRVTTTITATAGQTQFTTLSGYILGYVDVYLNGAKLINGVDFEAITGTYITLFTGAVVNDVVELVSYIPRGLTDGYTKAEADAKFLDVTGDIATGTLSIKNATISAQNDSVANWAYTSTLSSISNPSDIYFKPDGLKMFVAFTSTITQYALTTAWDITTATAGTTLSVAAIDTNTLGLFFSPDGTKMVICGTTGVVITNGSGVAGEDRAYYFTLSTAWDVTTATLVSSIRFAIGDAGGIPAALTAPQAVDFNSDGTIMYILDSTTDYVNQFALSTAYNVSTATYTKRLLVSTEEAGGTALRFNSTGTRMYVVGTTGDEVNEYRLTTAWDIASAVYYDRFYLGWYELGLTGLYISESANAAFICGANNDAVLKFLTDKYELQLSAETASGKIDLAGNTRVLNNFAVDGDSYFDGTIVIDSTLTGANITANQITTTTSAITLGGGISTGATALTTTQTTGTITVGGTAATGAITLGQSTAAQTLNLGTGATATATTKTINIGTAGLSGSTTAIQIGSAVSGATNTITINGDTTISGLTVGKGAGAVATNTAVGLSALAANTTGLRNTALGQDSLRLNNTGSNNTALGYGAGYSYISGSSNTCVGYGAGYGSNSGGWSVWVGYQAGPNTGSVSANTGSYNVGIGGYALTANTTASYNTAVGYEAGVTNTTGSNLALFGVQAGYLNTTGASITALGVNAARSNTTGNYNTAVGDSALLSNTTASNNTAVGYQAGYSNTTGGQNVAVGNLALYSNTTAIRNTAVGYAALDSNTTGEYNTAVGAYAGDGNTTGNYNAFFGYDTGSRNTTGGNNTAFGTQALLFNTTASNNTAVGYQAGYNNTTGTVNVAIGGYALYSNTTANANTALGYQAGYAVTTNAANTFIGYTAGYNTTGNYNTFVGAGVGVYGAGFFVTTGSKNTILGGYTGNQYSIDIRTASNKIVLSDGDGNAPGFYDDKGGATYSGAQVSLTGGGAAVAICTTGSIWRINNTLTSGMVMVAASGSNSQDGGWEGAWLLHISKGFGSYGVTVMSSNLLLNTGGYSFTFTLDASNLYVSAGKTTYFSYALTRLGSGGIG